MTRKLHGSDVRYGMGILAAVLCLFTTATSQATQLYYWNAPNAGSGTWDTTNTKWSTDSASTPTIIWNNTTDGGDDAAFAGSTYTVTVAPGGITVHNLSTSATGQVTISGSTLTLVGSPGSPPTFTCPGSGWTSGFRINSVIAGTSGFVKTGAAYFDLFGNNIYTGTTEIQGGMDAQTDGAFGNSSVLVQNGGFIWWWGDNNGPLRTWNNNFTFNGNGDGSANGRGALSIDGGSVTINGSVNLNGTIIAQGGGSVLTLNGPVTLDGDSRIAAGFSTGPWNGQLSVNNTITGTGANLIIDATGGLTKVHTFAGNISLGTASLTKNLAGIILLSGTANNWGKLNITEGEVQIGNGGYGSLPAAADIVITTTSYPDNYNGRLIINSSNDITISGSISGTAATTFINNSGGILVTNVGTLTLSGTNTAFKSPIAINGGKLRLGNNSALGNATSVTVGGGSATSQLELSTENLIISNTITLAGRSAASAPHIQNVNGGTNSLTGDLSLVTGGDQYVVQSDSGKLTLNTVTNNAALATDRYLTLQGAGNGEVSGAIANGTASNLNSLHVIKAGSGTWTLSGSNTYNGNTTINAGKLLLGSAGYIGASPLIDVKTGATLDVSSVAGGFSLLSGQTLGGSGTVLGNVTLTGNAQLIPGSVGTAGLLSFQNNLIMSSTVGNTVKFDLSDTTTANDDQIAVAGNLALPSGSDKATFTVNMLGTSLTTGGVYKLFTYQGTSSGNIANVLLSGLGGTTRQTGSLSDNTGAKQIEMTVSGLPPATMIWKGNLSGNWDFSTTNWTWVSNGSSDRYYDLDMLTFDNSGTTKTVTITAALNPGTMTVNSNSDYTFQGTGAIGGGTGMTLTKSGTGKLTIKNTGTNSYGGGTTINAGTLQIGDNTSGSGLGTGNVVNNGALLYYRTDDSAISGSMSGSGSLEKKGAGKLTLSGSNSFTGATTISNGQVVMGSTNALGPTNVSTAITISNSGSLDTNSSSLDVRQVTVQGAGAGTGAIVNNGPANINTLRFVTLVGDTTFGGSGRWDIRTDDPVGTPAWLVGNGYNLTKVGSNDIYLVNVGNTSLGNISIQAGMLGVQGNTNLGSSSITASSDGRLGLWNVDNAITKTLTLSDTAGLYNGAGNNTYSGTITLSGSNSFNVGGGTLTVSGAIGGTGILSKSGGNGIGNWMILTSTANSWSGGTQINGGTLQIGDGGYNGSLPDTPGKSIITSGTATRGELYINSGRDITLSNIIITGSGILTKNGTGTLTLGATNSFTGNVTILGNGALRLKNADALGDTLASSTALSISGGTDTSRLEFDDGGGGGYTLTAQPTITLAGRQPSASPAPHINNLSGNNSFGGINGGINCAVSGAQYIIQSDSGKLTFNGIFSDTLPTARYLILSGAGNGELAGGISFTSTVGSLSVIKAGTGIWTISGSSSHNGSTVINAGTLALAGNGSIGSSPLINVMSGATFDVSAVSNGYTLYTGQTLSGSGNVKGDVTDQGGAIIAPGSSIGTLTFNGNLTLAGGTTGDTIDYEFGGSSGDLLDVKGNLTLSGTTDQETLINPIALSSLTTSSFRVASVTGTLSGTAVKVVNSTRYTVTSSVTTGAAGKINLTASGSNASLIWSGTATPNNYWDLKNTTNWLNGSSADIFYASDAVTFNDSGTNAIVNVNAQVRPMSITVNADKDYTFNGTGRIIGADGAHQDGRRNADH